MKSISLKLFFVFALLLIPHFASAVTAPSLSGTTWAANIEGTWPTVSTPTVLTGTQSIRIKTLLGGDVHFYNWNYGVNSGKITSGGPAGTYDVVLYVYDTSTASIVVQQIVTVTVVDSGKIAPSLSVSSWNINSQSSWPTLSTATALTGTQSMRVKVLPGGGVTHLYNWNYGVNSSPLTSAGPAGTYLVAMYIYDTSLDPNTTVGSVITGGIIAERTATVTVTDGPSVIPVPGVEGDLAGYAWSPNIGWISFNCINGTNTCGTIDYAVHKTADGRLIGKESAPSGYAWSANVGWIQFGGLSGFPSGPYMQNAQIDGSGNLRGWARALSYGGGWDGWISLSGTSPNYGVTFLDNAFSGYAWGSDVVGWVNFDPGGSNSVKIVDPVDPASFSLGGEEAILIKGLSIGTFDSEKKDIRVLPNQAFITGGHDVEFTITAYPASLASTTYTYSFDDGISYSSAASLAPKTLQKLSNEYATGFGFKVRVIQAAGALPLTNQTITIQGRDKTTNVTQTKDLILTPVTYDPKFQEI